MFMVQTYLRNPNELSEDNRRFRTGFALQRLRVDACRWGPRFNAWSSEFWFRLWVLEP